MLPLLTVVHKQCYGAVGSCFKDPSALQFARDYVANHGMCCATLDMLTIATQ